jgi:hypothetical protein
MRIIRPLRQAEIWASALLLAFGLAILGAPSPATAMCGGNIFATCAKPVAKAGAAKAKAKKARKQKRAQASRR